MGSGTVVVPLQVVPLQVAAGRAGKPPRDRQPVDFFSLNYTLLALSGIWPPEGLPSPLMTVYVCCSIVAHFFFFTSVITYSVALVHCASMDTAIGVLCDTAVIYLTIYKIVVLLKNKQLINGLVDALKYDLEVTHEPLRAECRQHEEAVNARARQLTGRYYAVLLSVDATYIFMYLWAELHNAVQIPQYDPLQLRDGGPAAFFLYSCVPVSAALMSGIHTTVFDTMILTFGLLLGGKIDNLRRLLLTLEEDPGRIEDRDDVRAERLGRLHDAVRMHQKIITFVNNLESALSSLTLAQVLESLAAICLQGYRLTAAPPSLGEGIPKVNFLLWLLLQLWILCWSGENISTKSSDLAKVASRCHWQGGGRDFQTDMRLFIMRAQRPLNLTALKMVKLNYPVYLDIVKNSYSLYTCMLRMKSESAKKKRDD